MTSISNSEDQHCRLCNEHRPLQHSHILPAFVFKWLKKDGFIRHAESINQRAQDGAKAYWLCSSCEALFNGWETRFANEIFHPTNEQGLSTLRYGEWLLKFCASISWRSLLYIRERSSLTEYSQEEIDSVSDAQKTWAEFLRGERDHPGTFEQHLVPFGPIKTNTSIKFPPNINRHLLRNVEIDLARGASTIFVFSKLGRLAVLGFVRLENPIVGSAARLDCEAARYSRGDTFFLLSLETTSPNALRVHGLLSRRCLHHSTKK